MAAGDVRGANRNQKCHRHPGIHCRDPTRGQENYGVSQSGAITKYSRRRQSPMPLRTRYYERLARCILKLARKDQKAAMASRKNGLENIEEHYKWLRDLTDEAIAKRTAKAEFHGLEEELRNLQKALIESYKRSNAIKHPRDKGDQREEILRHFLSKHGLLPRKYAVATTRARVVAPSGHVSPEIDVVFHDYLETLVLKKYEGILEYYPLESVYGTIQVKSRLNKKALLEGLENIAKFKALQPTLPMIKRTGSLTASHGLHRRFGILFAYEYDLEWSKVVREIEGFLRKNPNHLWPNLIVILDKGHFKLGTQNRYCWQQKDIEEIDQPVVHGFPDQAGHCLLNFYIILMDLLEKSTAGMPDVETYTRMPLTAGRYSYAYSYGALFEIGKCDKHGSYLRTISIESIERILSAVEDEQPINWVKATDIAFGSPGDNQTAYDNQPGDVRIYNPENQPLSDILVRDGKFITYDSVNIDGSTVWLPWVYVERDRLIDGCPKCSNAK